MKKIIITLFLLFVGLSSFAESQSEALDFFNSYVKAANSYSTSIPSMYSDNAKIIRQVIKPDGSLVDVRFKMKDYRNQMKISSGLAKMRNYKNYYSNTKISQASNGYKIDSIRKPSLSNDKFKTVFIVQKQPSGKWLIVEEMMQTKEQIFLKYAR